MRLAKSARHSALSLQVTGSLSPTAADLASAICASCIPVVLVDNIVKFKVSDT